MVETTRTAPWTDATCPVARASDLVGDRWSLLIVRDAMDGARTFTDFQQRTGIARNILSDRLRRLSAAGLIDHVPTEGSKRKQYVLTPAGQDLFPVIVALRQWAERHAFAPEEPRSTLVDESGSPLPEMLPVAHDGTPATCGNSRVVRVHEDRTAAP